MNDKQTQPEIQFDGLIQPARLAFGLGDPQVKKFPCFLGCPGCQHEKPVVYVHTINNFWYCHDCGQGGAVDERIRGLMDAADQIKI